MAFVIIYTKKADPYSVRAMAILKAKQVPYDERPLPQHEQELIKRLGTSEVPQIIINGRHIGGFEQLGSLDLKGELDKLLREHGRANIDWHPDQPRT